MFTYHKIKKKIKQFRGQIMFYKSRRVFTTEHTNICAKKDDSRFELYSVCTIT